MESINDHDSAAALSLWPINVMDGHVIRQIYNKLMVACHKVCHRASEPTHMTSTAGVPKNRQKEGRLSDCVRDKGGRWSNNL